MTPDQFNTRYRLTIRADSRDVETWQAIRVDSNDEVMVHRLIGPRRAAIEHMLAYLDDGGTSRVVDQFIVGDTPVIVTTPLAPSSTFIDWLQDHVPPTVTALLRPIEVPEELSADASTPQSIVSSSSVPTASSPIASSPSRSEAEDLLEAFPTDNSATVSAFLAELVNADERRDRPASNARETPSPRSTPRVPRSVASRESGAVHGMTSANDEDRVERERIARSPRVRTTFDLRPDVDETSAEFAPIDDQPLEDVESLYSQIIRPRPVLESSGAAVPSAGEDPAPRRRSFVPIIIGGGVLVLAFVATLLWAVLRPAG